jgi:hypothetical protein
MFQKKVFVFGLSVALLASSSAWAGDPGELANKFVVQSHDGVSKVFSCGPEAHELKACKPFGDPSGYSTQKLNSEIKHQSHLAQGLLVGEGVVVLGSAFVAFYGVELAGAMGAPPKGSSRALVK